MRTTGRQQTSRYQIDYFEILFFVSKEVIAQLPLLQTCQNPKCRKQLWKDGGCLQLNCRTEHGGCGQVMCWLCQGKWDSTHSDHFHCNKFEAEKAKGQLSGAVKTAYQVRNIFIR